MTTRIGIAAGLTVDHLVAVGREARFDELGGPALYAALGARLVGGVVPVLAAALPDDDPRFRSTLAGLGVDLAHCTTTPSLLKVWILNSPEGRRIVTTAPVGDTELESGAPADEAADDGADAELTPAFLADLHGILRSSPVAAAPGIPSTTVVGIDPHQVPLRRDGAAYLHRVGARGVALLPSRVHLRPLAAEFGGDPRVAAARLAAELGGPVFARLDADGIYVVDGDRAWHVTDAAVRVEETTGAGDASAAAIVSALTAGADLPTAALFGASVARIALSDQGAAGLLAADPLDRPLAHIHVTQEAAP